MSHALTANGTTGATSTIGILSTQSNVAAYTALPALESGIRGLVDLPLNAEDDDALHRPRDDDDEETDGCLDLCKPWALLNVGALALMTVVIVGVFVGVPIWAFLSRAVVES